MLLDARELAKTWVIFPHQMVEDLECAFSMFLERLTQFHWESPEEQFTVTREDLPIDPDYFVDFQNLALSESTSHGHRTGYEIEQYWLEFSWLSHAIEAAHLLDAKIPGDALIWQELANQCYDAEGDEGQAHALAAALHAVAESLNRIQAWANEKTPKLNSRVSTGHPLGVQINGQSCTRRSMPGAVQLTPNELQIMKVIMAASAGMSGVAIASRLGKQLGAVDTAISRLNEKLSKLKIEISAYQLTDLRK